MRADSSRLRTIAHRSGISFCEAILESFGYLSQREGQPWRTMLAVCPNSQSVMRAALLAARAANAPVMFAATLNQVDLDGGYTKRTPRRFVELVRQAAQEIDFQGPIIIALDHGGPWLKDKQRIENLSLKRAMEGVKRSLEAAIEAGYDVAPLSKKRDLRIE